MISHSFQFTHPRGVRLTTVHLHKRCILRFQFTHPRGVRLGVGCAVAASFVFQFTHPRGVRHPLRPCTSPARSCFNSRTHAGCDSRHVVESYNLCKFQFTHPRGVRPIYKKVSLLKNSVSIHAPTRGATQQSNKFQQND